MINLKKLLPIIIAAGVTVGCQVETPKNLPTVFNQFSTYQSNSTSAFQNVDEEDCVSENSYNQFTQGKNTNLDVLKTGFVKLAKDQSGKYLSSGEYLSDVLKAKYNFNAIKLGLQSTQPAGTKLSVMVRTQGDDSVWSQWKTMKNESELILDKADRSIQYKVNMETTNNSETPTLDAISVIYSAVPVKMLNIKYQVGKKVTIAKPALVTRAEWGALPPKGEYTPQTPQAIVIHHTWKPTLSDYKGASTIRGIQKYHMTDPHTGWTDIGYHYLIGGEGLLYEGRPETALGAHTIPNPNKVGVCVIGDYDPANDALTTQSYNTLLDILTYLCAQYSISPDAIYGHREFQNKTCPGDIIFNKIPEIKQEIKTRLGIK